MAYRKRTAAGVAFLALMAASVGVAAVTVGASVDVREGDTWTKVKVVGVEGTRAKVRYDDGTEEWVGPDRMRPATPGAAVPPPPPGPAAAPARKGLAAGDAVEIKNWDHWLPATVSQVTPNWVMVAMESRRDERRWVEPWAVRVAGAAYDVSGMSHGRGATVGELPPRDKPAAAPRSIGDRLVAAPEGGRLVSKDDLEKDAEPLSFEGAHEAAGGGAMPNITVPPAGTPFGAWALRGADERLGVVLAGPGNGNAAVATFPAGFGKWSSVIRANLKSRGQLDTRWFNLSDLKPASTADDGNVLLSTFNWDKHLQVWKWDAKAYKLAANLRVDPSDMNHIESAILVDAGHAVVSVSDGQTFLIDVEKKQAIATVAAAKGSRVTVHPSGLVVGVVTAAGKAALLRADDFAVAAEFEDAGATGNVSVDAAGKFAAFVGGNGAVRVVKIADGSPVGSVAVGSAFQGRLDLIDGQFLLVDSTTLYDVKSGFPLWTYKMPMGATASPLASGQFLIAAPGDKLVSLAVATLPDAAGRAALKSARPESFLLRPGTAIKIDADFAAFGEDREKAAAALDAMLSAAGMSASTGDAPFHLAVAVAGGPSEKRDYAPDIFTPPNQRVVTSVDVPSNVLTATLTYQGQPVWSQELRLMAGGFLQRDAKTSFQDAANEAARPTAEKLKGLALPRYLPAGAKPGTAATLGVSNLAAGGFIPEKPAAPAKGKRP